MGTLDLPEYAQRWLNVVLIWVGFGAVAGACAKLALPWREPSNFFAVLTLGIVGSAIGPAVLSWALGNHMENPIGVAGLLSAAAVAFALMVLYRMIIRSQQQVQPDPPIIRKP